MFLDLTKTFDTLLKKLQHHDVTDITLKLIEIYLSDRHQLAAVNKLAVPNLFPVEHPIKI